MTQNGAPAATTTSTAAPVGRVFVLITIQNPYSVVQTSSCELDAPAGTRQQDLLATVLSEYVPKDMRGGVILHYSVHPAVIA